ncbi:MULTISPECIES: IS66-like element accessory protein TnpA [Rhizobium]|uniref:IS66-like element accessory protein TnpA n=1 Tax=Rhizobium TaxID=379 RepID=UPI001611E7A9|nr:transposase [Rhizobium leucaenae]MBB6305786.1 transposase [Rhizobium leucaenae]
MGHAILLTGPERRRRWSLEDRSQILAEAFAPGAVVSEVARRFEVSTGLIYTWRRQVLVQQAEPAFVPAKLVDSASRDAVEPTMFVDFPTGVKVRIGSATPSELAAAVMRALK